MKFFGISLWLGIKEFLIRRVFWLILLILPAILALVIFLLGQDEALISVTAGLHFNVADPFESAIFEALDNTGMVNFVHYSDVDELLHDVMFGRIEAGYVFTDSIHNAKSGDFSGIIDLYVSPRTIAAPILNDMVAAALLQSAAPYITTDTLQGFFPENTDIEAFVINVFARYAVLDIFMNPVFLTAGGESDSPQDFAEITAARLMRGIIGLSIHVLLLFAMPIFAKEGMGHMAKALKSHKKLWLYNLSLWLSVFTAMLALGAAGLLTVAILAPQFLAGAVTEIAAIIMLCAVCATVLIILGKLLKSAKHIQAFGLFIIIANIIFGGLIIDLNEFSQSLGTIQQFFPLFWYTAL